MVWSCEEDAERKIPRKVLELIPPAEEEGKTYNQLDGGDYGNDEREEDR